VFCLFAAPSSMAELYVDHVGTSFINVSWSRPDSTDFDAYTLDINPPDDSTPINIPE